MSQGCQTGLISCLRAGPAHFPGPPEKERQNMHILIAEDDLDMQKILRLYLQKEGY